MKGMGNIPSVKLPRRKTSNLHLENIFVDLGNISSCIADMHDKVTLEICTVSSMSELWHANDVAVKLPAAESTEQSLSGNAGTTTPNNKTPAVPSHSSSSRVDILLLSPLPVCSSPIELRIHPRCINPIE